MTLPFDETWRVIGHPDHRDRFQTMVRDARQGVRAHPSPILLAGPQGVGKRLTCLELARHLNCPDHGCSVPSPMALACDEEEDPLSEVACSVCPPMIEGVSTNWHVLGGPGETIGVGAVRDLKSQANQRSVQGGWSVYVIDHAHALTSAAADGLLKLFEDGRPQTVFAMVTHRPREVRRTLRSRALHWTFGRLAPDDLDTIFEPRQPMDRWATVRRLAQGSVARALAYLDGPYFDMRTRLVALMRGLTSDLPVYKTLDFFEEQWAFDDGPALFELWLSLVRDRWMIAIGHDDRVLHRDLHAPLASLELDDDQLDTLYRVVRRGHRRVRHQSAKRLVYSIYMTLQEAWS